MRLGIDLGTTRVVVAAADRGNYPVVTFESESGEGCEWYPSLCAVRNGELRTGDAAQAVLHDARWQICRSLKRTLAEAAPGDLVLGIPVAELLARFLGDVKQAILHRSNLEVADGEDLEVAISVPANATANQRMLTIDAFTAAGFKLRRLLDEPSAAGLEYAWRRPTDAKVRRRHVAVYDLGGGTFDASIIALGDGAHEVITTEGIARLGGDDFDEILLSLSLKACGQADLAPGPERDRLLEICRDEKEHFTTATKRLKPDLFGDGRHANIKVDDYEEALRPLIARSLEALETAIVRASTRLGEDIERHTVVYQVGGGSQLPTVSRILRERFGRRVWRSPYAHASVAVGLAIASENANQSRIQNRFTRHFGVWRDTDGGRCAVFDAVFPKDTPLPDASDAEPLTITRRYRAMHNVGHFRFVECSRLRNDGAPGGDVTPWCEVRFPLVSDLRGAPLEETEILRLPQPDSEVEERYRCDANGVIEVDLVNISEGYKHTYRLRGRAA